MDILHVAADETLTDFDVESELAQMRERLVSEGKSNATIGKYLRDLRQYFLYVIETAGSADACFDRDLLQSYRIRLASEYEMSSANSMIAGINYFLGVSGQGGLKLKSYRMQREVFRPYERELTREEYFRLLDTARSEGNERLYLLMMTIGSTGIRISELPFITVESLASGRTRVMLKGKSRVVIMPVTLCLRLADYAGRMGITEGSIFITRSGRPVDRSNVLHAMKRLSERAGVSPEKVFPHNLRHLFAVTYYRSEKDLSHLADILGHSNINTTRIYTAVGESAMAATIENLGLL